MNDIKEERLTAGKDTIEKDPMVFESRVKGENLCETMSNNNTFEEDIKKGYGKDTFFRKW
jgi:hypothetical protein